METLKDFVKEHPDIDLGEIGACYASCQGKWPENLDEALSHTKNCPWCLKWMKEHDKLKKITRYSAEGLEEANKRYRIR